MLISELRMHHPGSALQPDQGEVYGPGNVMRKMWNLSGNPFTISDGEWRDEQQNWLINICPDIARWAGMPEWVLEKWPGDKYRHYPLRQYYGRKYAKDIRKHIARQIEAGNMPELPYVQWAIEGYQQYQKLLREKGGDTKYLVSLPTPYALLFFAGLPIDDELLELFERLMADTVTAIVENCPGVVIEWALPTEYAVPAARPMRRSKRQRMYRQMMESPQRVIRRTPRGTLYSGHRCAGDLGRRPVVPRVRQTAKSQIDFDNAFIDMPVWWEENGWVLFSFHDPYCDGRRRPRLSRRLLRLIRTELHVLPQGATYIPGVLQFTATSRRVARILQKLIAVLSAKGIEVRAVTTSCGQGRLTHEQGTKVYLLRKLVNRKLRQRGVIS